MGDFFKYISSQEQFRDYQTGEVHQNPNIFGNPYRKIDKKKGNNVNPFAASHNRTSLHLQMTVTISLFIPPYSLNCTERRSLGVFLWRVAASRILPGIDSQESSF